MSKTEHFGGIDTLSQLEGVYFRDFDGAIVIVEGQGEDAIINSERFTLQLQKGHETPSRVTLGDYILTATSPQRDLQWTDRVGGSIVIWKRVPEKETQGILALIRPTKTRNDLEFMTPITPRRHETPTETTSFEHSRKLKTLRELTLPILKDTDFLGHHLTTIDNLATALGVMNNQKIDETLAVPFVLKAIISFGHAEVQKTAQETCSTVGYNWNKIKDTLIKRYCRRDILKSSYQRRLRDLKFPSIKEYELFLGQAMSIFHLLRQLYNAKEDLSERRMAVREILGKLPAHLRREVILNIFKETGSTEEWEVALPFDDLDIIDPTNDNNIYASSNTVIEIIRQSLIAYHEVDILSKPQDTLRDDINSIYQPTNPSAEREELNEWTRKFYMCLVISGDECKDDGGIQEDINRAGFEYKKIYAKKTNRPYYVVAVKTGNSEEKVTEEFLRKRPGLRIVQYNQNQPRRNAPTTEQKN